MGKNTGFGLFLTRELLAITGMTIARTGVKGIGARCEIAISVEPLELVGNECMPSEGSTIPVRTQLPAQLSMQACPGSLSATASR